MYDCGKDCLILIPFRLPQISCFTLSLKRFTSDSDNCPDVGIGPLPQFPHSPRTGQGDVREETVVGNACGGKLGSHGSKAVTLSHA